MILNRNLFESYTNSNITIQVINGRYWDFILEEFNYEYYDKNKNIEIDNEFKDKLNIIEKSVESRIKEICPINGNYFNDKIKRNRLINFNIKTTQHWYTRYFRKKYEDSRYLIPDLYDGLDIIKNNIDELTKLIDIGLILNNYRVLIKSRKVLYSEIVFFEKISPHEYQIELQTQMKGKDYFDNKVNRIVKLPPKIKASNGGF